MIDKRNKQRIWIYLGFAFGISWAIGLVIYLTGGLENSPTVTIADMPISLALILLSTAYMFGPALANVITRRLTKEGKKNLNLKPHFDRGRWIHWISA